MRGLHAWVNSFVLYACRPAGAWVCRDWILLYTCRPAGATLVHWLWVLGFALAICKNMVLKGRNSAVLDSETFSTVQPNLRC